MNSFNPDYKPSIYSASKIWHNTKWLALRDVWGYNIISRWINVPCGTEGNMTGAKIFTPAEKAVLWQECDFDARTADMMVVYAERDNEMRGALVEMGIAMGNGKPIYVIGTCPTFEVAPHSDVAFMYHPLVKRIYTNKHPSGSYDYESGYADAVQHYLEHYHTPERFFANMGFLNRANITGRKPRIFQEAITN